MAKIIKLLKVEVKECNLTTNKDDIEKGLKWVVLVEDEKTFGKNLKAPTFPDFKSYVELKPGQHYLEIKQDAFIDKNGRLVRYVHILKVHEVK
ncbi:MAG: hypothetical protein K1X29_04945 [Bdellovibrionales bacterium]|nr:hypothetical protein [Bdellovibrionales bacterium]